MARIGSSTPPARGALVPTAAAVAGTAALARIGGNSTETGGSPASPATPAPREVESQSQSSGATPVAPQPVTQAQMNSLLDFLAQDRYQPNPLNGYHQVAYHFRLFLAKDEDIYTQAGNPTNATALFQALDSIPTVIIAESGVTAYSITEVTMESTVGPNAQTHNVNMSKVTIKITEPYGVGFLDSIKAATLKLGIRNRTKCPYYLELTFRAYDENGNYVGNPLADYGGTGGRWIWQLQFTNVEVQFDSSGGHYTITAMLFNDSAFDTELLRIKENMTIAGNTLGEMARNLAKQLTDNWRARYGANIVKFNDPIFYPIPSNAPAYQGADPARFTVKPREQDRNPARNLSMDTKDGQMLAQVNRGTSLTQLFDFMIANSEEGQHLALDRDNRATATDGEAGHANARRFRESVVFRIESDIKITGFDYYSDQYVREITLHIRPHVTQAAVTSVKQRDDARDDEVQRQMVMALFNKNFLRKRYDYLFTGQNTEVIDFDVAYNFKWNAIIPQMEGANIEVDAQQPSSTARLHPGAVSQTGNRVETDIDTRLRELEKQIAEIDTEITQESQRFGGNPTSEQRQQLSAILDPKRAQRESLVTERNQLAVRLAQRREAENDRLDLWNRQNSIMGQYKEYSEVLFERNERPPTLRIPPEVRPISVIQTNREPENNAGIGLGGAAHRDRSLFGCVLEQLNGPVQTQLINIKLNVRGDPYWLGLSNLARLPLLRGQATNAQAQAALSRETPSLPDWFQGDQTFLLTFRYPFGVGDDFAPQFRPNEVFNGIYRVKKVDSIFSGGQFRMTLDADILPLIDVARAFSAASGATAPDNETGLRPVGEDQAQPTSAAANAGPAVTVQTNGDKAAFIREFSGYAQEASAATGIDPRIILAQSALETGWGRRAPNNNYFGIKGAGAVQATTEFVNGIPVPVRDSFRTYQSPAESFRGYASFINSNPRYSELRQIAASGGSLEAQAAALGRSGYATDPAYGQKVLEIARNIRLPSNSGGSV